MALVDSNYCFLTVDVGAYGREGDSNIFKRSPLGQLHNNKLNVPGVKKLPNEDYGQEQPFVIVGDEAFGLNQNLLRLCPRKTWMSRKKFLICDCQELGVLWNAHLGYYPINGGCFIPIY
ncbi:unnamed protein product [Macrosiphum euphorbiae]|uniref:DDE Tnp4 domain-containing protein n=1 Tax=Macrosiphum euphorbiae TaxID=13131 RepID=A0AAV0WSE1_9HEMI|nr:unnamed protein product [Macrosiphum euphorbiae]